MWPPRRVVGEVLLSVALALAAVLAEVLSTSGTLRIVGVALLAAFAGPLRRVLPATVLLFSVAVSTALPGLGLLVPVAAWSAGRRIAGVGRAAAVFAVAYLLGLVLSIVVELPHSPTAWIFPALALLVFVVVPGLAGRYSAQRRTLVDTLREYNAQMLRERTMVAEQARMRERQRIAQDMHDSLGHQLVLMSVHSGALEVDRELTDHQRAAVRVLREASVAAMHELREVVGLLRDGTWSAEPAAEGEAATRGVAGIDGLVAASRAAGTEVELRRTGTPCPLASTVDHAAYRVAQEGLTNAHKHAPGAAITVELRYEPDSLIVEVANGPVPASTGAPHSVVSGGQGLTGLSERTRLIGGMLHASATAAGGFRLAGVLPYAPADGTAQPPAAPVPPATFVDATSDLRRQPPVPLIGQGGPVIDGHGLPKELVKAMSKNRRSSGVAIGCGIAALVVFLLLAGLGIAVWLMMDDIDKAMIDREDYDAVRVGQSEAEVRDQLPDGKTFLTDDLDKGAPPEPAGATCLTLLSSEPSTWSKDPVFRFCFKGGVLVEKRSFMVET
ncbi:sensor histidine kinase [Streptomyces sp. 796.1]|uniref:sensor histidine kinase n=1 Tax=Streptomyces sp. 796.1 TaxID=3163029 RepID=UPI0039C99203